MSMWQVFAPGKLVLCGEYAVLLPGGEGLVLAVSSGILGHWEEVADGEPLYSVETDLFPGSVLSLTYRPEGFHVEHSEAGKVLSFVLTALERVWSAAAQTGPPPGFRLRLKAEGALEVMTEAGPAKLGLGSSAAVVTATVKLALSGWKVPALPDEGLKLALEAHAHAQGGRGSGVDVAASFLGGLVHVKQTERGLEACRVAEPLPVPWLAVWTGQSAKTVPRVAQFQRWRTQAPVEAHAWMEASTGETQRVLRALKTRDVDEVMGALRAHRQLLRMMGDKTGLEQETSALERMGEVGALFGVGKQSGAGGGDCGIIVYRAVDQRSRLEEMLRAAELIPLDLTQQNGVQGALLPARRV